jgi:hypothetical protein
VISNSAMQFQASLLSIIEAPSSPYVPGKFVESSSDSDDNSDSADNSDMDSVSHALQRTPSPHAELRKFDPTVPRSESGSPEKPKNAPLDPQRPQQGMIFSTLEEAVHFVYEYERRRGYVWRKGESERNKQGTNQSLPSFLKVLTRLY